MADLGGIDLTGAEGGKLAAAFATGCTATWVFVRNLVMRPAIKSCHQRIADLEADREHDKKRISDLELALFMHGNGAMRAAMQAAVSENHVEINALKQKVGGI
ncbi:hypothetical protein [Sphingomonas sp. SRS2]|uniref:hypothetical protein n=1 Tax=Sphingomonas sp. SRS2 TaxID=133190 RepID=UPI0006184C2F|nr:hypothetical protein [Sphingomonas sp. SRS2]KKC27331.1 hypothetical protein WP12_04080 [Sphingomonas sp. SRS2]